MIKSIQLENFKCFLEAQFDLRPLTVLCGLNGSGKSSIVQAILLGQVASRTNAVVRSHVRLNGDFGLELGSVADVYCHQSTDPHIGIIFSTATKNCYIQFDASSKSVEHRFLTVNSVMGDSLLEIIPSYPKDFCYLSADRMGPCDIQFSQSMEAEFIGVGVKGEYAAEVLAAKERQELPPRVCNPKAEGKNRLFLAQVESWMGEWSPGIQISVSALTGTNAHTIRIKHKGLGSEWMRPTNTGFGISHSLPIVIAGLAAKPGSILIIDSPESHLHPRGQTAMGRFLATIASNGVQVIVETHSDHIINGFRISTAERYSPTQPEDVIIYHHFIGANNDRQITKIEIDKTGMLTDWPVGFSDQVETDLALLSKLSYL